MMPANEGQKSMKTRSAAAHAYPDVIQPRRGSGRHGVRDRHPRLRLRPLGQVRCVPHAEGGKEGAERGGGRRDRLKLQLDGGRGVLLPHGQFGHRQRWIQPAGS